MRRVVNYDGDVTSGKAVLQPLRNGKRWIGPVLNPENNLESRISLAAAGRECFLEQRFVAAECQTARNRDPASASNRDPFPALVQACPGSEQEGPARSAATATSPA